jgi:hypothetical protein
MPYQSINLFEKIIIVASRSRRMHDGGHRAAYGLLMPTDLIPAEGGGSDYIW